MSDHSIFEKEERTILRAQELLENKGVKDGPLGKDYAALFKAYKKLFRQTSRLVKLSDRQQEELRELNEVKNKFLGMAAHDLRNPCTTIRSLSEFLLDEATLSPDQKQEFTQTIHRTSGEMLRLLNDLLDVSVIESGKLSLRLSEGKLGDLIDSRVLLMRVIADRKQITIKVEDLSTLPAFQFDPDRMSQVVDNFISNAIKFSEAGTTITVTRGMMSGRPGFSVRDQGPGIPEDEQEKLFGSFQKLSVAPTAGEKSTGLGLAIVKKIVDAHQGVIAVESTVGQGSTFTVSFGPAEEAATREEADEANAGVTDEATPEAVPGEAAAAPEEEDDDGWDLQFGLPEEPEPASKGGLGFLGLRPSPSLAPPPKQVRQKPPPEKELLREEDPVGSVVQFPRPAPRVLLIDDDAGIRMTVRMALTFLGAHVVAEAANGREGAALHRKHKPDMTLCDVEMPVQDGLKTVKEIIKDEPHALVVMLSSVGIHDVMDSCLLNGAAHFIRKDVSLPELRKALVDAWISYRPEKVSEAQTGVSEKKAISSFDLASPKMDLAPPPKKQVSAAATASGGGTESSQISVAQSPADKSAKDPSHLRGDGGGKEGSFDQPAPRVLLIDDNDGIRMTVRMAVSLLGGEVVGEAPNGKEGAELYRQLKPDLTLLDLEMPVQGGLKTVVEIVGGDPRALVVMLSSVGNQGVIDNCLMEGAAHYIRKDVELKELKQELVETWRQHRPKPKSA
ncbi:MAG: hybrid sensor histidine kinase/response regulator [Magnetococcales bacterium]|nr:hybrid sensor histidine kinase/response regulator [Magnetococcales bacterium]